MTINEEKQLRNYIKRLVRESIGEMDSMPSWWNNQYGGGPLDNEGLDLDDELDAMSRPTEDGELPGPEDLRPNDGYVPFHVRKYNDRTADERMAEKFADEKAESDRYEKPFGDLDDTENQWAPEPGLEDDDDDIAGLNELRTLAESMARDSFRRIIAEKKSDDGKRKKKKEKTSSKDKTVLSKLNADGTNAAHYFYKLYGVENGTEDEKAAARSKGYKKAKGKKNDTGVPYKFSSKERNRLSSLLTDRG